MINNKSINSKFHMDIRGENISGIEKQIGGAFIASRLK